MQAKYRGHGAEMAFARVFVKSGVDIVPEQRHTDPMAGYDPNVDLSTMEIVQRNEENPDIHSFDLVVKDLDGSIRVLVQSLIHSSDPGQYGVNKSDETVTIKNKIERYNLSNPDKRVYLLGSIDGVGFCENPRGTILKMIDVFDEFFQINTLFKIPLFLYKIGLVEDLAGITLDEDYFESHVIEYFEKTYLNPLGISNSKDLTASSYRTFRAGKAIVAFE